MYFHVAKTMDGQAGPVTAFSVGSFKDLIVMTVNRARAGPHHAHLRMVRNRIASLDRI